MAEYYEPPVENPDAQAVEKRTVNKALTRYPEPYISGLKLNADIEINGLVLNTIELPNPYYDPEEEEITVDDSRPVNMYNPYGNGVVWISTDVDGWWNLPDSEIPDLPRGWGDGSYDSTGRFASRLITLSGAFLTQDPNDAPAARNRLLDSVNLVKTGGWLKVREDMYSSIPDSEFPDDPEDGDRYQPASSAMYWTWSEGLNKWIPDAKSAYVRLSGAPQVTSTNARGRHDFSVGLKAADPVKYEFFETDTDGYQSKQLTTNGTAVEFFNEGNAYVPVILEISSSFTAPTGPNYARVYNSTTDETITILGNTGLNTKLEIDTYNREVLEVDYTLVEEPEDEPAVSNARSKVAIIVDWIQLEPGANNLLIQNFPSGASCTVYYKSGWIS